MKKLLKSVIVFSFLITTGAFVHADGTHPQGIKRDGTVGIAGKTDLPGPDYEIKAEFGKQTGANLFHSFEQFNIHKGESATFSGPDSVQNIISRVTGGSASWIDGKLGSSIPNANLYFLNPAGVMFGANASLDLGGSFHVSTADYLRLGENEKFYAMPQENEILSVAPPAAFGFLNPSPAETGNGAISIEGKGQISQDQWDGKPSGLAVSEGKTLSLVGGDIEIKNGAWFVTTERGELGYVNPNAEKLLGSLTAPGGQINMVSVASAGEVAVENGDSDFPSETPVYGNTAISGKSLIDVSGQGAGNVFIRSGKFVSDDSSFYAKTFGDKDGGGIEIQADSISFENGSEINGSIYGSGKGGDIILKAFESLTFSGADEQKNAVRILLETHSRAADAGDTGTLDISAGDILFSDGAYVSGGTFGSGNGGSLTLRAEGDISFGGVSNDPYINYMLRLYFGNNPANSQAAFGGIVSNVHAFSTGGNSGDVVFDADNIFLSDSASVFSTTVGPGNSGSISISANRQVEIKDSIGPQDWAGGISTSALASKIDSVVGDAGHISLESGSLTIKDGRYITSGALARLGGTAGRAGEVNICVTGDILLSGINPHGGQMVYGILTPQGSLIGASNVGNGVQAGNIFIEADSLTFQNGGGIAAATYGNAEGGSVTVHVEDSLTINGSSPVKLFNPDDYGQYTVQDCFSRIEAGSYIPDINSGNSGTVSVHAGNITVSEGGMITTASAGGGKAGDITLETDRLELDSKASVTSESTLTENGGEAGIITVNADSVRLSGNSSLSTEAKGAGGGKISVNAGNEIYLLSSEISSSVKQGYGNGGDVAADSAFLVLNHSTVSANAEDGDGGAVFIRSENFVKSSDSSVSASSARGNQGTVEIQSPDLDISSGLMSMPENYLEAEKLAVTPCAQRSGANVSTFVIQWLDAMPLYLDDWLPPNPMMMIQDSENSGHRESE